MCRNIRTLSNFEPPATAEEVRAASAQFVRKISGFSKPSKANTAVFEAAVEAVSANVQTLIDKLVIDAPARDRQAESLKAKARSARRSGSRLTGG